MTTIHEQREGRSGANSSCLGRGGHRGLLPVRGVSRVQDTSLKRGGLFHLMQGVPNLQLTGRIAVPSFHCRSRGRLITDPRRPGAAPLLPAVLGRPVFAIYRQRGIARAVNFISELPKHPGKDFLQQPQLRASVTAVSLRPKDAAKGRGRVPNSPEALPNCRGELPHA